MTMLLQLGEETYSIAPKDGDEDAGDEVPYGQVATYTPPDESCHYLAAVMDPDDTDGITVFETAGALLTGTLRPVATEQVDADGPDGGDDDDGDNEDVPEVVGPGDDDEDESGDDDDED